MHGLSKAQANDRLAELIERIHLAEVWNQRIDSLSKGFKRRVGIAQTCMLSLLLCMARTNRSRSEP
jgi:ABC-2 type transport system ATP-binding protein